MSQHTINRAKLVEIITAAAIGRPESIRIKLLAVATTTDAVAVGWFHCDGVGCPARQARYRGQVFQERFDRAMYAYFGMKQPQPGETAYASFVVKVKP